MKNTLLLVADLGNFKAFKVDNAMENSSARLELLEEFHDSTAHAKLVDRVTDAAGRFPRPPAGTGITGAMSQGERHNIELEQKRRSLRRLAGRINSIVRETEPEHCYLAASREINRQLLAELEPHVRGRIEKVVPMNLTNLDKSELLRHFEKSFSA